MFPAEGETLFGSKFFTGFGGKAPNQAVMCKRLGDTHTKVSFIGKLGNDENGRAYRENFEQSGVDVKFVGTASEGIPRYYHTCNVLRSRSYKYFRRQNTITSYLYSYQHFSGVASIWVDSNRGENMIIIVAGANDHLKRCDMEEAESLIKKSKYLAVTLESEFDGILAALEIAKKNNVTTIMNAAPAKRDLDQGIESNNLQVIMYANIIKLDNISCKINSRSTLLL